MVLPLSTIETNFFIARFLSLLLVGLRFGWGLKHVHVGNVVVKLFAFFLSDPDQSITTTKTNKWPRRVKQSCISISSLSAPGRARDGPSLVGGQNKSEPPPSVLSYRWNPTFTELATKMLRTVQRMKDWYCWIHRTVSLQTQQLLSVLSTQLKLFISLQTHLHQAALLSWKCITQPRWADELSRAEITSLSFTKIFVTILNKI